jgi:hypothetical protein
LSYFFSIFGLLLRRRLCDARIRPQSFAHVRTPLAFQRVSGGWLVYHKLLRYGDVEPTCIVVRAHSVKAIHLKLKNDYSPLRAMNQTMLMNQSLRKLVISHSIGSQDLT